MKRKWILFILLCLVVLAVVVRITANRFIVSRTIAQLSDFFPGSEVSVRNLRISPFHKIEFNDIKILKNGIYKIVIGKAVAEFNLRTLLAGRISMVGLSDSYFTMTTEKKDAANILQYVHMGTGDGRGLAIEKIRLDNIHLDVNAKDLKLKSSLSLDYSLAAGQLDDIEVDMPMLESRGVIFKNISIESGDLDNKAKVTIGQFSIDKGMIKGINGILREEWPTVFLDFMAGNAFGGRLEGNASVSIGKAIQYFAQIRFMDMEIARFVKDFELEDKFFMDGELNGDLVLQGEGADVRVLGGDFKTALGGGIFIIKDTRFLENIAASTKQPADLIVDNFRNYHYNTGIIGLSLEDANIVLDLALDGDEGKRDLNITLHEFLPKKDGL